MRKPALFLLGASALLFGLHPALADPPVSSLSDAAKRPKIREVRMSFDLLEADDSGAQAEAQAEPFVAVNPERESHVVAVYQEERFEDGGARSLSYAVSTNGGRTWREGLLPGLTQASGGGFPRASDPWVAFGLGGRVYFSSLAFGGGSNGVFVSASADGGATWDDPVAVQHTTTALVDKPAMTVDTRDDSPWQGRVYVAWMSMTPGGNAQSLHVSHSADEGASFSRPVQLASQGANNGAIPVVAPGGGVHLFWFHREGGQASIRMVRSDDGGETWSAPMDVARISLANVPYLRTGSILPAAAVDGRDGTLYVVWQDGRLTGAFTPQIFLSVSTDGGASWSEPELVSDGPLDAPNFTPSVAVNGDGVVAVAYTSLRNDPSRSGLLDQYIAFSKDGGRTFRRSQRLSTISTYAGSLASAEGYFQGDYQGLAAGAKTFYRTWIAVLYPSRADRRVFQPDAFTLSVRP